MKYSYVMRCICKQTLTSQGQRRPLRGAELEEAPPARGIGGGRSLTLSMGREMGRRNLEGDDSGRPQHCALWKHPVGAKWRPHGPRWQPRAGTIKWLRTMLKCLFSLLVMMSVYDHRTVGTIGLVINKINLDSPKPCLFISSHLTWFQSFT